MPIVPDDKDWTWVLERACPECGFNASQLEATAVAELVRDNAAAWRPALLDMVDVTKRPSDAQWSPLEYACHVRDVFSLYDSRLTLMLTQDDPTFPNWDQDVTAVEDRYNEQSVVDVLNELEVAGDRLAESFSHVTGEQWQRTGLRSDGTHFTVDTFGRYMIHDPVHHLHDIGR